MNKAVRIAWAVSIVAIVAASCAKEPSDNLGEKQMAAFDAWVGLYGDGAELYQTTLTRTGTNTRFDVDLTNVSELTIVLEPMIDGYVYYDYDEAVFVGGIYWYINK